MTNTAAVGEIFLSSSPPATSVLESNPNTYGKQYRLSDTTISGQTFTHSLDLMLEAVTFYQSLDGQFNPYPAGAEATLYIYYGWTGEKVTDGTLKGAFTFSMEGLSFLSGDYMTFMLSAAQSSALGMLSAGTEYAVVVGTNQSNTDRRIYISRSNDIDDYAGGIAVYSSDERPLAECTFYIQGQYDGTPLPMPGKAVNVGPSDTDVDVAIDSDLVFTPGSDAVTHGIYFGTSFIDVNDASTFSSEYQGPQTSSTFDPGVLGYYTDYFWRVDESNTTGTTKGDVWTFRTALRVPVFSDIDLVADYKIDPNDLRKFTSKWMMQGDVAADLDKNRKVDLDDFIWIAKSWLDEQQPPQTPNILFIMSDDHAQEAIGCYNSYLKDYIYTPNIDRLAAEGMRFNNVCSNMSLCSPSRASFVTGQYAHIHGVQNLQDSLLADSPSYIIELQNAGYQTATYGKWHMGQLPRGCDDFRITTGQGKYFNPSLSGPGGGKTNYTGYASDVYTDLALDFLANRDSSKPFYLGIHFKGTHHPYDYPDRLTNMFNVPGGQDPFHDIVISEPGNLYEDNSIASPNLRYGYSREMYDPTDTAGSRAYYYRHDGEPEMPPLPASPIDSDYVYSAYQHMLHKYSRCSTAIDENVGRVLDYLEQEGLLDNTIVVYTSDQGYFLGQHEFYDKRLIYEESLKIPFIIRYPAGVTAGSVNDELVGNVDFARTILDFVGVDPDPDMQGRSFRSLAQGQVPQDWQDALFYRWKKGPSHWGIRTKRYKLVLIGDLGNIDNTTIEFYDLEADPNEMNNLASDPDHADEIQTLRDRLGELKQEIGYAGG